VSLYRAHLNGTGHEHLIRDSLYVHAFRNAADASLETLDNRLRRAAGATLSRIGAADLRALEPALSHDFKAAVVIEGQARAISPGQIGQVLSGKLRQMGGEIERAEVRAIAPAEGGGWRIETQGGGQHAPKLVIAMGVWSAELLKPLGVRIPLEAERGYHVSFTDPGVTLNNSIMDVDMKVVASSMDEGLRIAGTAEFAGLDAPENDRRIRALVTTAVCA
jgi:D-amino-acid dehydrogenase